MLITVAQTLSGFSEMCLSCTEMLFYISLVYSLQVHQYYCTAIWLIYHLGVYKLWLIVIYNLMLADAGPTLVLDISDLTRRHTLPALNMQLSADHELSHLPYPICFHIHICVFYLNCILHFLVPLPAADTMLAAVSSQVITPQMASDTYMSAHIVFS